MGVQATVGDQFTDPPKVFDLTKPTHLCTPVDKEGEGVKNPDVHLMCYQVEPPKWQRKHQQVLGIFVNNQLGPGQVDTLREEELCMPSNKTLLGDSLDTEPDDADVEEDEYSTSQISSEMRCPRAFYAGSLNLSHFVAHKIWRRRGVLPLRCRAHHLQRRGPLRGLLVPMATISDLLQTAIN